MDLRELAKAVKETWPQEDAAALAFASACSPERVLALLDVVEAAQAMPELTASSKTRWWREDGLAGRAVADHELRAALTRWQEVAG